MMQVEAGSHQPSGFYGAAWLPIAEHCLTGPFAEEALEGAVASALPAGPWMTLLAQTLTNCIVTAILYMQFRRLSRRVRLQFFQFDARAALQDPQRNPIPTLAHCGPVPSPQCGWSYFLVEMGAEALPGAFGTAPYRTGNPCVRSNPATIQVYLFPG